MTSYVFDTGALSLLYAKDERLRPIVDGIEARKSEGFIAAATLAEFYYKICQSLGRDTASHWSRQLSERMTVVEETVELALAAGHEKCRDNSLSLADEFALALTRLIRGTLLTTDSQLSKAKDVSVRYLPMRPQS